MKKRTKKLTLAKETLQHLNATLLGHAAGGVEVGTYFTCPDTWYQCSTYCGEE